jgi:hypothetical protein
MIARNYPECRTDARAAMSAIGRRADNGSLRNDRGAAWEISGGQPLLRLRAPWRGSTFV